MQNDISLQFGCVKIIDCFNGCWKERHGELKIPPKKEKKKGKPKPNLGALLCVLPAPHPVFLSSGDAPGERSSDGAGEAVLQGSPPPSSPPSLSPPAAALGLWVGSAPLKMILVLLSRRAGIEMAGDGAEEKILH